MKDENERADFFIGIGVALIITTALLALIFLASSPL